MSRSVLRIVVIVLTAITALVHLYLGINSFLNGRVGTLSILWLLNGLGYAALLAANFVNVPYFKNNRKLARYLLIGFAIVTIAAWFFYNMPKNPLAYPDKIDEALLVIATFFYIRAK